MIHDKGRQLITEAEKRGDDKPVSLNCPITLALKETFKVNFCEVNMHIFKISKFPENLVFEKPIPDDIWKWAMDFNISRPVELFEFKLSLKGVKL